MQKSIFFHSDALLGEQIFDLPETGQKQGKKQIVWQVISEGKR